MAQATPTPSIQRKGYAHPEVLVTADWVAEHARDPKARILESNEDILLYDIGHILGALKIDWHTDLRDPLVRDYLDRSAFAGLMSKLGIAGDTTIVFYGDKNNWWASNHPDWRVMDGGRKKWETDRRPLVKDVPSYPQTQYAAPDRTDAAIRVFREDVLRHLKDHQPLTDVRSPREYRGELLHNESAEEGLVFGERAVRPAGA
ncbi:MAG TPA: rhodanese-like domain-containing protein [bacterium]|nr:rhodanese-like domain-containing protein [bacterium]